MLADSEPGARITAEPRSRARQAGGGGRRDDRRTSSLSFRRDAVAALDGADADADADALFDAAGEGRAGTAEDVAAFGGTVAAPDADADAAGEGGVGEVDYDGNGAEVDELWEVFLHSF